MPRYKGLSSVFCSFSAAIAVEGCAPPSTPRAAVEPTVVMACGDQTPAQKVDSTVRFQREVSFDSALAPGEIVGTVISASTGEPVMRAELSIEYPDHRHTRRSVSGDSEGHFRMRGLPDEDGVLYAGGDWFRTDSLIVNPRTKPVIRFALHVTTVTIQMLSEIA